MADATVIQLAPDSSVSNVITFDDAFDEHSELFGLSYNQRMARKRRRQARRLQRIRDRQERRKLRRQGRLEAEQERQAIKDDRAEHRYKRKHGHDNDENGSGDTGDGSNGGGDNGGGGNSLPPRTAPIGDDGGQDNTGGQSSGNEYANDGGQADGAPQGGGEDSNSQGNEDNGSSADENQQEGDSSENFDGVMGAEDRFAEFSDSDTLQVHPSVQDLANKIEWNKELISRLEVQAAIARGKDESTDPIYNEINKRLLRITELENQLHGYANGLGNFSSANGCYCSYDGTFNIDTDSNFDGENLDNENLMNAFDGENLDNENLMNAFDGDNLDNEELMSNVWGGGSSSEQSTQSDQSKAIRKVRAKRNYGRKASVNAAKSRAWKKRVETTGARLGNYNVVQGGKAIPIGHWKDKRGSIMLNVGDMVKVIGDHNKSYFKGVVSKNGMSNGKVYFIPKNILNSVYSQRPKYYQNRQGRAIQPTSNRQPIYNQNTGGRTFTQPQSNKAGIGSRGFAQGGGSIYSNAPRGYTPVSASLRPIISPNRVEVTLNADGDIGKPTGLNGLDNINDFNAPATRIFELKSNADDGGNNKGLNFTGIAIGVGVAAVAVWALNKYKII
jgi:hypothetical protein